MATATVAVSASTAGSGVSKFEESREQSIDDYRAMDPKAEPNPTLVLCVVSMLTMACDHSLGQYSYESVLTFQDLSWRICLFFIFPSGW